MLKRLRTCLLPLLLLAAPTISQAAGRRMQAEPYFREIAERFSRRFPDEHLSQMPLDDTISTRAWSNFLASLDDDRVYFLASDIAGFQANSTLLDDEIERGNLDFAFEVFDVFKKRVSNRCDYVSRLLDEGMDIGVAETYKWRRKDEPWPADETEWNEIWRKKIKNEYVQRRVVAKMRRSEPDGVLRTEVKMRPFDPDGDPTEAPNTPEEPPGKKDDENDDSSLKASIRNRYKQYRTVIEDNDAQGVMERYLSAFAHAYDPHSDYMSAGEMEDFDIEMKLSLVGIGALLGTEDGAAKVERLIPGGPADKDPEKRLQPGDKIIEVGQGDLPTEDIRHLPLREIVKKIRGEKGTKVVLIVIPASDPSGSTTKRVELTRDEVKLEEQAASWKLIEAPTASGATQKVGVLTLPTFYANMKSESVNDSDYKSCAYDVEKILRDMMRTNVDGLVMDLRNNGGGSLAEVVNMTGLFIPSGPVVQVKERKWSARVLRDDDPSVLFSGPMVVLINRLSASASEILVGALQDYGRAVIVGDSHTHGKGTVQTILDVGRDPKLGAMRVTNAMFYRITGSSTQLKGVTPDIILPSALDCMDLGEEFLVNPLGWDRIKPASFTTDPTLLDVVSILKERSEGRRREDPRFAANDRLLEQIRSLNRNDEVPIDLASRMKLAETEKEITQAGEEASGDKPHSERELDRDLVLAEGIRILADLAELRGCPTAAPPEPAAAPENKGLLEWMSDWLRN